MKSSGNVGSLNVQLLFETLAKIIGERENVDISVKSVTYEDAHRQEEKGAPQEPAAEIG